MNVMQKVRVASQAVLERITNPFSLPEANSVTQLAYGETFGEATRKALKAGSRLANQSNRRVAKANRAMQALKAEKAAAVRDQMNVSLALNHVRSAAKDQGIQELPAAKRTKRAKTADTGTSQQQ